VPAVEVPLDESPDAAEFTFDGIDERFAAEHLNLLPEAFNQGARRGNQLEN
jgi:hypothetical protein